MSKKIVKQGIELILVYFSNGPMGVSSSMSKTRSKQGSEENWWDLSNVYNTIEKKDIEENWHFAPMGQLELAHLCLRLGRS